jgi:hypothetical protein
VGPSNPVKRDDAIGYFNKILVSSVHGLPLRGDLNIEIRDEERGILYIPVAHFAGMNRFLVYKLTRKVGQVEYGVI